MTTKGRIKQDVAGDGADFPRPTGSLVEDRVFRTAMDAVQVGVVVLHDRHIHFANAAFHQLFGFGDPESLLGSAFHDLIDIEHHAVLAEVVAGEAPLEKVFALHRQGHKFPVGLSFSPTEYEGRTLRVGTVLDLRAQAEAERKASELANFDVLTGLPNRRLLRDRMSQLLAMAERDASNAALMFIDLDHFKRINDSLGHSVGDDLLCAIAQRFSAMVRSGDTLARLGGDEFVLVSPGLDAGSVVAIARRLAEEFTHPFVVGGHDLMMTTSIGISIYPEDGADFETLLKNADTAMYRAKEQGRNTIQFYASDMNTATLDRLLMESNLRRALRQSEFTLVYQPLISLQTGLIVGVEALVRWLHPEVGCIMPDRFIPIAEETGLINPLGDWVLLEACQQAQRWIDQGLALSTMAVNVAPGQFRQSGFVEMVAGALAMSGLAAECLELEVTERTVMYDAEVTSSTLGALHRMGIGLSLDDFGTGYSSLAYLKRIPVGKLKIDRSFICDLVTDPDDQAIASTIVSMGRNLRLTVLAEGVETKEQFQLLRNMDCDMAQGYHFSYPLPADQMEDLLRQQPFLF